MTQRDERTLEDIYQTDCIAFMQNLPNDSIDFTITDIPYNAVNRSSNGLRNLNKENADLLTFDLVDFLNKAYSITKNNIIIFCGKEQFSDIFSFFSNLHKGGTVRPLIWEKANPNPMNGQYVYLSGIEMVVWFKKKKSKVFNAHCKNTVFKHPNGRSKFHPTEKNHALLKELILDNSNSGDLVFDPCFGSGSHLLVAKELGRKVLGCEIDKQYFAMAKSRLNL